MDIFVYTNAIFLLLLKESFIELHMPPCVKSFFMGYKWLGQAVKWNSLFCSTNSAGSVLIVCAVNVHRATLQTNWKANISYVILTPIPTNCVYFPVTEQLYDEGKVQKYSIICATKLENIRVFFSLATTFKIFSMSIKTKPVLEV